EEAGCLGKTTNNVAEYTALVRALERAAQMGARRVILRSDSELLVKQMSGEYRVKNAQLLALYEAAREWCKRFDHVSIMHVRREQNSRADALCNKALDGRTDSAPSPAKKPQQAHAARRSAAREDTVRADAVACLHAAATAWKQNAA